MQSDYQYHYQWFVKIIFLKTMRYKLIVEINMLIVNQLFQICFTCMGGPCILKYSIVLYHIGHQCCSFLNYDAVF